MYNYSARYTMTLYDAVNIDNSLLDILDSIEIFRNNELKEQFLSYWGIYEIGAETLPLFKDYLKQVFNEHKFKYQKLLNVWNTEFNYLEAREINETIVKDGTDKDTKVNISNSENATHNTDYELPNKSTLNEYPTFKNTFGGSANSTINDTKDKIYNENITNKRTEGYNPVEQRIKYSNAIRDVIMEFVKEFKECFIMIW